MAKATRELRDLPDEELVQRLEGFKEELFNLRFQYATGQAGAGDAATGSGTEA